MLLDSTSCPGAESRSSGQHALSAALTPLLLLLLLQSSRDVRRSATFHSAPRGQGAPRRDPALDFLQEAIAERNPELRSLHLDKLVGRGSFGRVYKGVSSSSQWACHEAPGLLC